jgi:ubiquinol-cytochrome c reductase iron-sulfur subunit
MTMDNNDSAGSTGGTGPSDLPTPGADQERYEEAAPATQPTPVADAHAGRQTGHVGTVAVAGEDPFADPGLPVHHPRRTDVDERAARRAERQVAAMFTLSMLFMVAFIASFVLIDVDTLVYIWPFGSINAMNAALGTTFGAALLLIGVGAIHWARKLMAAEEIVEERHELKSTPEESEAALAALQAGVDDSALPRRKLIGATLLGAMGAFAIAPLVLLRDLGPLPEKKLRVTAWKDHHEIVVDPTGNRLRPENFQVGSLVSAKPKEVEHLDELAKAAIVLIRLQPDEVASEEQLAKSYEGIMAFSKICTHVGCPLGLYEQTTHHMLCPCHQSTFDLADRGRVVFGPAARSLPQLAITVDDEGFLVAKGDFDEPVGPSFWERG